AVDPDRRVEVLQLGGEVNGIPVVLEERDLADTRFACEQAPPRRLDVVPERAEHAEAGDHHPPAPVAVGTVHIPNPPSTSSTSPVMNEASSEHRNRTARATSSGSPRRPRGVFCSISSFASSGITSVRRVWT